MENIVTYKASGIYEIRNTISGRRYIGSAINIRERWNVHKHLLRRNKSKSPYLQNSWNKYGEDSFAFSVIEYCNKKRLIEREQFYIDTRKPEYNIAPVAGSTLGKRHSEESKRLMSRNRQGIPMPSDAIERMKETLTKLYRERGHGKLGKKEKNGSSKYFGVCFNRSRKGQGWQVRLTVNKNQIYLGQYKDEIAAARVYDDYVLKNNLPRPLNFAGEK